MNKFHFQQCISNSWNEHCPNSILGQHLSPCREISALVRISLFFHKSKRDVSRRFSRSWGTLDESPFLNISWGLIVNNVTYFHNNMVSQVYPPPPHLCSERTFYGEIFFVYLNRPPWGISLTTMGS